MTLEKLKEVIIHEFTADIGFIDESIKKLKPFLDKDSKILDIGTGFGIMAIILALNGFNVLTGEPEEDPDSQWEHHEEHHGDFDYNWRKSAKAVGVEDKIKYQHFDAQDLPFSDKSFDAIFLYDALQHIQNRKLALKECIRVIKPDGMIGIIETNKKGIEYYQKTEGFTIDYVDPRGLLDQDDISTEVITGKLVNMYMLRKT